MEELKQTVDSVLKKILGKKARKFAIAEKIKSFYEAKGFSRGGFDVDVKRKYIYIRVESPYQRQEMSLMVCDLEEFLKKESSEFVGYEIKFTGRL